jgi:phosphatidylglycerophosphatase C
MAIKGIMVADPEQAQDIHYPNDPKALVCVAAFDVDGTLTWTDSFMLFLRFSAGRTGFFLRLFGLIPAFLSYVLRLRDRDSTKNLLLSVFLKGMSEARYQKLCTDFARAAYPIIARPDALSRLNNHLGVRDEVAFVSASLADYLAVWAQSLGVETVLATRVSIVDGILTGQMAGVNCRCEQKVVRIQHHFGACKIVAAYGDSPGDEQMLAASLSPGYRVFHDAPTHRRRLLWDLYFGNLLERRAKGAGL